MRLTITLAALSLLAASCGNNTGTSPGASTPAGRPSLTVDKAKCAALKAELAGQPEPHVVPIDKFFDGNNDDASIGCNLAPHPGMNIFRDTLTGLQRRPGVEAVYALISELDPGKDEWPFTDAILVAGPISEGDLQSAVSVLSPDDVSLSTRVPASLRAKHAGPILEIWWD